MAGAARGKMIPVSSFGEGEMKMPEGIFGQTITGNYFESENNVEDRDMLLEPNINTLCMVPWMEIPTASLIFNGFTKEGAAIESAPKPAPTDLSSTISKGAGSAPARRSTARSAAS